MNRAPKTTSKTYEADKAYYQNNKEKIKERVRLWRKNHSQRCAEYDKERPKKPIKERYQKWKLKNREKIQEYAKQYRLANHEQCLQTAKRYRERNKTKIAERQKLRKHTDIDYKILCCLRGRIHNVLKRNNKSQRTIELIGCSVKELKYHLEVLFRDGMSWNNYGYGADKWHIDHIIPCSFFYLSDPTEQKQCFHYTNLQPMWQSDNISKNDEIGPHSKYISDCPML